MTEKLIDKLRKMQAARDGEAKLGNAEAAEAFAAAINRLMLQHEISEMDLKTAVRNDTDEIVRLWVDLRKYGIKRVQKRVAWQERLAGIVAQAHLCRIFVTLGSNSITFVGTKAHAEVAEFMYGTLVPLVEKMSQKAYADFWWSLKNDTGSTAKASGYRAAWINAFVTRISERLRLERRSVVDEAANSGQALMRLDNALARVDSYIKQVSTGSASAVTGRRAYHADGARDGRAAADRVKLGKDQLTSGAARLRA
jgi:hypothetical protein